MDQSLWFIWLIAMIAFSIVEFATENVVSVWFVGGSLAALITQLLGGTWPLQIGVFLVVSAILLACLRPFVKRFVTPKKTATNVEAMIGKQAVILQSAPDGFSAGTLKLDGKEWSVRSISGQALPAGMLVSIVKVEGVTLFVEPVHSTVG